MRISYLFNSSTPSSNPGSIQVVNTCDGIASHGHKIILITPNTGKNVSLKKFYGIKNNIKQIKIKYFKKFPLRISYYLFSIFSVFYGIFFKTEIFITRNFFTLFLLNIFKKRTIIEIHHNLENEGRIIQWIFKYIEIFNKKNIIKIVAITKAVKKFLIKSYNVRADKIEIIPSGSSLRFNFKKLKKKNKYKIGYFGSLDITKGSDFILKLSKFDKKNNYYIYGGNKDAVFKLRKINKSKNLKIYESINYGKIKKYISKMDILLIPSNIKKIQSLGGIGNIAKYTSPLKLFDYLASGKLIICTDTKVYHEILTHRKNCIMIKNLNIQNWKKTIFRLTKNLSLINTIKRNSYNLSKKYTYKIRAKTLLNFKIF
jgi:glycosyltransferase involved in cell wall biosynthesis